MSASWIVTNGGMQIGLSFETVIALAAVGNELRRWGSAKWAAPSLELAIKDFGAIICSDAFDEKRFLDTICQYESSGLIAAGNAWVKKAISKELDLQRSSEKWFWAIVIAAGAISYPSDVQNIMTQLLQLLKQPDRRFRPEVAITTALEATIATAVPAVIDNSKHLADFQTRVINCNRVLSSMRVGLNGPLQTESLSSFEGEGLLILAFLTWLLTAGPHGSVYPTASLVVCRLAWLLTDCGFSIAIEGIPTNRCQPKRIVKLVTEQGIETDPWLKHVIGVRLPFSPAPLICLRGSILLAVARPCINHGLVESSWVEQAWELAGTKARETQQNISLDDSGLVHLDVRYIQRSTLAHNPLENYVRSIPKPLQQWLVNVSLPAWQLHGGEFHLDPSDPATPPESLTRDRNGKCQAASVLLLVAAILRLLEPFVNFRGGPDAITACGCEVGGASQIWEIVICTGKLLAKGIHLSTWRKLQSHCWAGEGWSFPSNPSSDNKILYTGNSVTIGYQYLENPGTSDHHLTQMVLYESPIVNIGFNDGGYTLSRATALTEPRTPTSNDFISTLQDAEAPPDSMTCILEPVWGRSTYEALHKYRVHGTIVDQLGPWETMLHIAKSRVYCSCTVMSDCGLVFQCQLI